MSRNLPRVSAFRMYVFLHHSIQFHKLILTLLHTKASAFSLDFSAADKADVLDSFDFDAFLNEEEGRTEQPKSDQVSSEAAPSQHEKKDVQPDHPTPRDTGDSIPTRKSRKRKATATFSTDDNSKPQANPDTTPGEGQSKRIRLDPSSSGDESSSTVLFRAGTETQNSTSSATNDQSSASNDAPIETLDAWILRWTKLEQTELK